MESKKRRFVICSCALVVLLVVVVVLAVTLSSRAERPEPFRADFIKKCETWTADEKSPDCEVFWSTFERAYVGRNPWQVQTEAYDVLMCIAGPQPACNRMLFYSGTKELANQMSKGCYRTVEDSMLGSILDNQTWCGKEGSTDMFTTGCPEWNDFKDTPAKSFWKSISAKFATVACGNTFVLLNGSNDPLYQPDSIFSTIEITKLTDRVKRLTVFLVPGNNVPKCEHESMKYLEEKLDPRITFICKEKTKSELLFCAENNDPPCGAF